MLSHSRTASMNIVAIVVLAVWLGVAGCAEEPPLTPSTSAVSTSSPTQIGVQSPTASSDAIPVPSLTPSTFDLDYIPEYPTPTFTPRPTSTPTPAPPYVDPQEMSGVILYKCDGGRPYCRETLSHDGYIALVDFTGLDFENQPYWTVPKSRILARGRAFTGRRSPVPFTLTYDAADISEDSDYAIVVYYSHSQKEGRRAIGTKYTNLNGPVDPRTAPTLVLTKGRPSQDVEVPIDVQLVIAHFPE